MSSPWIEGSGIQIDADQGLWRQLLIGRPPASYHRRLLSQRRHKAWSARCVGFEFSAESVAHFRLFGDREPRIHDQQKREHHQREQRRPLQQKAQQDKHEGNVLRMANSCIGPSLGQGVAALRVVQNIPGARQQVEAEAQEHIARDMQDSEVGISFLTQKRGPQVTGIVRQQIDARESGLQPAGHHVDGQREAIHLDEERNDEGGECAEGPPVTCGLGFEEAEREHQEDGRIENDERPQTIGWGIVVQGCSPVLEAGAAADVFKPCLSGCVTMPPF